MLASLSPEDQLALVGFDHEYHEWVPSTRDHARILEVISYGETKPAVDNKTAAHRAQNRRVVINVLE